MNMGTVGGVSWLVWVGLAIVAVALIVALSQRAAKRRHREQTERLAVVAEAEHESARTRHEGGA